jgi:hypothetical protein
LRGPVIDGNGYLYEGIQRAIRRTCLKKTSEHLHVTHGSQKDDIRLRGLGSMVVMGLAEDPGLLLAGG